MADQEYTTKIKIETDTAGGEKAVKSLDCVEKKADSLTKTLNAISKASGFARRALMGFGVLSVFTSLIGVVENLRKKFGDASKKAEEFRIASEKAADTKRVEKLTTAYDNLKNAIDAAAKARERANELEDMALSAAREQEDIDAQAAKDAELAALDPTDRYYEQKKAQIEAKYSGQAANRAAQRKVEDAERTAARTAAESEAKSGEAVQGRVALIDDRAQLDVLRRRLAAAKSESVSDNARDIGSVTEAGWINFTRTFGLNGGWSRLGDTRTAEGDEKRKEAEARAKGLEAPIKAKEKDIAEKERKIAELEEEAQYLSKKSVIQSSMAENAKDAASVTRAAGLRSEQAATAGLSGQIESERDAARAKALLESEKARLEQQIAAQQQRKADAGTAVFFAQGALSNAQANGDRRGTAAAAQQLASAESAAQSVEFSAGQLINRLTAKLKQVESLLNKANSAIEKNNSQRLAQQAESLTSN